MRLFRKSKAAQDPEVQTEALDPRVEIMRPPSPPPPALQLNFQLPSLPSSSLDFGGPVIAANNDADNQPIGQMRQHEPAPTLASAPALEPAPPPAAKPSATTTLFEQLALGQQKAAAEATYAFDYPVHCDETAQKAPDSSVKNQLMEQFGHRLAPNERAGSSSAQPTRALQARTMHQQIEHILASSSAAPPVEVRMLNGSPSTRDGGSSSSDDDNGVPKLSSSMAAMTLAGAKGAQDEGGVKMSDRAMYIQRMREASALGKIAAFSRTAVPADEDAEDESDLVPLGGLRQMRGSTAPSSALGTPNSARGPVFQQQPQQQSQQQQSQQQQQQQMRAQGAMHRLGPYANPNPGMSMQSLPAAHNIQSSPLQQMAYPRAAGGNQSMFQSPMAGNSSVTFGGVGMSRGPAMQDQAKAMYTPSPLRQMPMYCQPAMEAIPAMSGYIPVASNQMHTLAAQQQSGALANSQQSALMSFIPNRDRCGGSMAKNPLMRDINKAKEFSARDYSSRPTLLAEADSRRMAKKNMPGLGGTTCHSFQPEVVQPQQPLPDAYAPRSPPRPHGHRDYDPYYAHRPDAPHYTPPPRRHPDDMGHEYISSSSSTNNKRRPDFQSARGRTVKRHSRYEDSYDHYDSRARAREFRQQEPQRRPRGRGTLGRSRRRRHDDYDHYDYDDDDYSDSYASDYYDEWDNDNYYDDRVGERRGNGRSPQHRSRGNPQRGTLRMDGGRWKQPHGRRDEAPEGHRRHRSSHLDDPRDSNGVVRAATRVVGRHTPDAEPAGPPNARPRSQFGRMLANIKRHATVSKTPSPRNSPSLAPETCGDNGDTGGNYSSQARGVESVHAAECMDNSASQIPDACSEVSDMSPANSACPTPAAPVAAVVAAN
ncbi:hypothetical protein IWW50_003626 [Coemansia erecta]|nr:hypothetical protein IWW50_003626 [Coemansia erecta]